MTSEEFIAAIEYVLWVKNAECAFLNPKDYATHMTAFSRQRYEPNTHVQHLRTGFVGSYGTFEETDFWHAPKPIYVAKEIPEGEVIGVNLPVLESGHPWMPSVKVTS